METIFERAGALDVHKAQVTACVRVPDAAGRREPQVAEFATTVQGLMALRDWLAAHRVTHVAMEATGVYWQPVWHILEDDFELTLCNARHVKNVASWAGQCPGNDQSAGKRRSGRTRKGSMNLNIALKDAAMAATRTSGSYLQALYRRKRGQLGHGRALGAVKHSMICACWHMLSTGELYNDLGGDYYTRLNPERHTRRLVAQLERLGHTVTLHEAA